MHFLVCFGEWCCENKSWSQGSVYPYMKSGGDLLQAWIRYWDDICVNATARKIRNVIQGCGQGKWKPYFAQVPVLVSPWSDVRTTVLLLVFIQHKQVLFLGQLLIYILLLLILTDYLGALLQAVCFALLCAGLLILHSAFIYLFIFNWVAALDCSEWSTACFPLCSGCHGRAEEGGLFQAFTAELISRSPRAALCPSLPGAGGRGQQSSFPFPLPG